MKKLTPSYLRFSKAFTLMEVLVVIAIIIVLAAIAYPVISKVRKSGYKTEAIKRMQDLGSAAIRYTQDNDGVLPDEDVSGKDNWAATARDNADKAWYNALPRLLGAKGVGDFVRAGDTAGFYRKENVLFLPGAQYPTSKMMTEPLFAIAYNSKLHRRDPITGDKASQRLANIQRPDRTVLFLEQGLPGEERAHPTISKKDYDGAPKGSAKSFVARYNTKGILTFFDGHVEEVTGEDILNIDGTIKWDPEDISGIFWTPDPGVTPEKVAP